MSIAILFPGQGSQSSTMLQWLDDDIHARPVLDAMAGIVGNDWRARSAEPGWLAKNGTAQCLVTGMNLAVWQALQGAGLNGATVMAGYSVGEVGALSAAGVYDFASALRLAALRADAMDRAASTAPGGLLAVSGRTLPELTGAMARWRFELAIDLAADRFVLGGPRSAIDALGEELRALGASTTLLNIAVASHTSYMAQAAAEFADTISCMPWQPARVPLVVNASGSVVRQPAGLKAGLARQISHTVHWRASMQTVAERLPHGVIEAGPGAALSRLWMADRPEVPARSADEFNSAAGIVAWANQLERGHG